MTRKDSKRSGAPPAAPKDEPAGHDDVSRRVFVRRLTFMGGGVVLVGGAGVGCKDDKPPQKAPPPPPQALVSSHKTFTNDEWATLSAAVDRVLPKDEDPGALEAGVPEYIDRMLQTPALEQMRKNFVPGLAALERRAQKMFKTSFWKATAAQQDELLTLFKNSPETSGEARWYEMLVVLTLEGFLGDPSYGGNRGEVGWKLVGFELVGRNVKGDPKPPYDGSQRLDELRCGGKRGC
ncbi:MAG: gluconate 2-dehydrogenase subunit 3 family protein [Myxococcota bacterium]